MKGKRSVLYYINCAVICALLIGSAWYIYRQPDSGAFARILLAVSGLAVISLAAALIVRERNYVKNVSAFAKGITAAQRESLYNFPSPAIIIDGEKNIIWSNLAFDRDVLPDGISFGKPVTDFFEYDEKSVLSDEGSVITLNGRFYKVKGMRADTQGEMFTVVYLSDETAFEQLKYEYKQSRPTVMLVVIDNYDELLQNAKESEKSHTVVEIEKLVENFIESTTGVAKKISSDRFMMIVEERHLVQMIKNRFPILDKAREIKVGERRCVTLSIGVGHLAENIAQSEVYARQALDMCLGRGGDQAAVKTDSGFEFFGGVSNGMEKRTKVKSRIIATALLELVKESDTVFIMGHKMGDMDSVGAATGLCAAMRSIGNEAYVVVDPDKNLAKPIINYIKQYEKQEFYISPSQAIMRLDEQSVVIIVDTHNPDFVDSPELYHSAEKIVVMDHHRKMVKHIDDAVIFFHEPQASSVCEMITELIQYFGDKAKLTPPQAEAVLAGIMLDTKNFVMRTGVRTFEAAAYLRRIGADTVSVKKLFSNSIDTYQQKSMLITNAEVYEGCAVATARASSPSMKVAAAQAADELLGINGVDASFVMYEDGGIVYVSARSMGAFNVQIIMEALGGGGHQTMAGAQLKSTLTNVKAMVFQAIDDYLDTLEESEKNKKK